MDDTGYRLTLQMGAPRYISTRSSNETFTLSEAISLGLAPDGGLFVPDSIPDFLQALPLDQKFSKFASSLLTPFLCEELAEYEIEDLCISAFPFVVPLIQLHGGAWDDCYVLELFHGPTLSFKDFGARMMGRLLGSFNCDDTRKTIVLVATSGDTGSAVADGFAGFKGVEVIILYPAGQVSKIQEQQLIAKRPGVTACKVEGAFDDCQKLVKAAFIDDALSPVRLTSANSINIGRLLPQMIYYVWASSQLKEPPVYCVPSGNLGNMTAGMMAKKGGMPSAGFIAAHNANRFFPDFLRTGKTVSRESVRTISNAMDVGAPSNYERLKVLFSDRELMDHITGYSVTDAQTAETLKQVYRATGYLADPHTAVALHSVERFRAQSDFKGPIVVLSTAHPAKFAAAVEKATGVLPPFPDRLRALQSVETEVITLQNSQDQLRAVILDRAFATG